MNKTAIATVLVAAIPFADGVGIKIVTTAHAEVASSIIVRGNRRVETETIKSYVSVRAGKSYSADDIDGSLKALYASGLFSDVKITREGGSLVVVVAESPLVNKVAFEGNRRLTSAQLETVIESKSRAFLSQGKVQSDVQRLLEVYRRNGRYRAAISPKVIDLPDNRVNLVFEVDEGDKTAVSRIDFVGNHAFSDGRLRDVVKTRETGLLGFIRSTDTYDPDRLNSDQELIRQYYLKNGYADFRMVSASADLDRDRNVFFVTFTVDEGEQYRFGTMDVQTSLPELNAASMTSSLRTQSGDVYNASAVEKAIEDLVTEASKRGYAFAQVRPRAVRDYANKTISITYYVDEGARVYVDRINVRGNTRTRDYVIRREFDMVEGDAYNKSLISRAERRLKALSFFKDVKISTEPSGQPDRVVVNVDVEEQSTGEIGFGAGYSTTDGILGDVSLTERNFLGRGQYVKASVQRGAHQSGYSLSFTEPYFLGQRISAGFDVYKRESGETKYHPFHEDTVGGAVRFALPITENFTVGTSWSVYQRQIDISGGYNDGSVGNGEASTAYKLLTGVTLNDGNSGSDKSLYSIPSINFVWNSLDNVQFPHDGMFGKLQFDFAGAGGDVTYLKTTAEGRYYRELWADWGVIGALKGKAGYINGLGNDVRAVDNFMIGGETIRGFATNGIGPRDLGTTAGLNQGIGGTTFWAASAELMAPLPGIPDEFGLYGVAFADVGDVFGVDGKVKSALGANLGDDDKIRSSAGVGILWRSPFGPLRADFALPITKGQYDQTQVFRFSGGTTF